MMNGTKKSDSSIVPAKPANKAERSTAELVEGSDGTKRNAELQSTVRTQSREAVSQAQARIRGAVTRNEKEKLTALLHHISINVLRWAFFNIASSWNRVGDVGQFRGSVFSGPIHLFDWHHPSVPTCTRDMPTRAAAVKDGPPSGHRFSGARRP